MIFFRKPVPTFRDHALGNESRNGCLQRPPRLRRNSAISRLPNEPGTNRTRRRAGLAVTIVQGIRVHEPEDVGPLVVRSHHELAVWRESAPQRFLLIPS